MTSKEALNKLNNECIHSNNTDDKYSTELHIIDKDLVVVEILKKYVYLDKKDNLIKMKVIGDRWENFNFEIIKEWLKNEN